MREEGVNSKETIYDLAYDVFLVMLVVSLFFASLGVFQVFYGFITVLTVLLVPALFIRE